MNAINKWLVDGGLFCIIGILMLSVGFAIISVREAYFVIVIFAGGMLFEMGYNSFGVNKEVQDMWDLLNNDEYRYCSEKKRMCNTKTCFRYKELIKNDIENKE